MKTELQGLKPWSCIYLSLEWRVYDHFGDPEDEESKLNETPVNNTELISRAFKSLNLSWDLTGDYQTKNPAHKLLLAGPNINHNLPILTSQSQVIPSNPDLSGVARAARGLEGPSVAEVSKTARIRLRIPIPPPQNSTGIPLLTRATIIPTPGINVNGFESLPYFLRFLTLRCDRSHGLWRTLCTDLYADYALWAPKANAPAIGKIQIGIELHNYNIYSRVFNGKRYYVGVRLKYLIT